MVPQEAHNLQTQVRILAPQQVVMNSFEQPSLPPRKKLRERFAHLKRNIVETAKGYSRFKARNWKKEAPVSQTAEQSLDVATMPNQLSVEVTAPDSKPAPSPVAKIPAWQSKNVEINSINLRALPVDWNELMTVGRIINKLQGSRVAPQDLSNLKPHPDLYFGLPMIASVVANRKNPEIPIQLPTEENIRRAKSELLRSAYTWAAVIGHFSPGLAERLRGYIGKRVTEGRREGETLVVDAGEKIADIADEFASIKNPRAQFLNELTHVYKNLQKHETRMEEGFFGSEEVVFHIEGKIFSFLGNLKRIKSNPHIADPERVPSELRWLNNSDLPMLLKLFPKLGIPPDSMNTEKREQLAIAGAELMEGLEMFLKQQGVADVGRAPAPREFDIFDANSWMRGLAELFAPEKLEQVKNTLPEILFHTMNSLPTSGSNFAEQIYEKAENICVLDAQGHSPEELAQNIFSKTV